MVRVSRRSFITGAMATAPLWAGFKSYGQPPSDVSSAVSIIDASVDTSSFVGMLERAKVQVVARYLSRGCQPEKRLNLMRKRIAFNPPNKPAEECGDNRIEKRKPEHEYLLEKFALLSVYQYQSNNPRKFAFGLPESNELVQERIRRGVSPRIAGAQVEAEQDAHAAIIQSARITQPDTTPIYFGVDFNMLPSGTVKDLNDNNKVEAAAALEGCLEYFGVLKRELGDRLGVYGNGYINRILRTEGRAKFSWVSESRSFEETPKILREGFKNKSGEAESWHLFQHLIDAKWIDPTVDKKSRVVLELDGNVANPAYEYFGAWKGGKPWAPETGRSAAVLKDRRVANKYAPVFNKTGKGRKCGVTTQLGNLVKYVGYHRSVRVHGPDIEDDGKTWLHVDVDDDGFPEGYCLASDFSGGIEKMPDFKGSEYKATPSGCQ